MSKSIHNDCVEDNMCIKDINSESESDESSIDSSMRTEELVFNPYNNLNKEVDISDISELLKKYGIFAKPFNMNLYKR